MKPLVLWCRWHNATLRLRGRNKQSVWGELFYDRDGKTERFRFELATSRLTRGEGDTAITISLDELGVAVD